MTAAPAAPRVHAYIDAANLHKGIESLGWRIDYRRFRPWIRQKFGVSGAYIFIGLIPRRAALYRFLRIAGFRLVFKDVVFGEGGVPKGNCDADLVLQAVRDYFEIGVGRTVLVSSDGDYAPLVRFFIEKGIPCVILSPAPKEKCSVLLKRTGAPIVYLDGVRSKICRK
jgi:uncharacterized LabA/DUF88 family protein